MDNSNLPPGCNSADGGIDHAMEAALEQLCDTVATAEVANAVRVFVPLIEKLQDDSFKEGWKEGQQAGMEEASAKQQEHNEWLGIQLKNALADYVRADMLQAVLEDLGLGIYQ